MRGFASSGFTAMMYDGSVKACFDKTIGNIKLASPVEASFDAPALIKASFDAPALGIRVNIRAYLNGFEAKV